MLAKNGGKKSDSDQVRQMRFKYSRGRGRMEEESSKARVCENNEGEQGEEREEGLW